MSSDERHIGGFWLRCPRCPDADRKIHVEFSRFGPSQCPACHRSFSPDELMELFRRQATPEQKLALYLWSLS